MNENISQVIVRGRLFVAIQCAPFRPRLYDLRLMSGGMGKRGRDGHCMMGATIWRQSSQIGAYRRDFRRSLDYLEAGKNVAVGL